MIKVHRVYIIDQEYPGQEVDVLKIIGSLWVTKADAIFIRHTDGFLEEYKNKGGYKVV